MSVVLTLLPCGAPIPPFTFICFTFGHNLTYSHFADTHMAEFPEIRP